MSNFADKPIKDQGTDTMVEKVADRLRRQDQPSPSTSSVQFTWMPSVDPSPITYYLWEGTNSVQYYTNFNVGTNLSATVSNLARGATYYFAVTAVATNGVASLYSTEASFTSVAQPTQPGSFHIIVVTP